MSTENWNLKQLEGQPLNMNVYKCKFGNNKGPWMAVKKIKFDSTTSQDEDSCWQSLMDLRNENVVSYHRCYVTDSVRYIVMDLCWASMMDFCSGTLQMEINHVMDIAGIMTETARGLHFLHGSNIIHGRLRLDNILLWRKRPNMKPIVKLSGYYPRQRSSSTSSSSHQPRIEDDLQALGCLFYSMAAKDVNPPKLLPVSPTQLSFIGYHQRKSASEMINAILMTETISSVKDLLMDQSFFQTSCSTVEDRMRNVNELQDFYDLIQSLKLNSIETKMIFNDDDVNGLKDILIESSSAKHDVDEFVSKAMEKYPKLFAEFVWDLSSYPSPETLVFVQCPSSSSLGSGAAGSVFKGKWIKSNQEEMPVACKRFDSYNNGVDKFYREYQTLRQLDHSFVVKCFGTCGIKSDKCLIMELCEGTLENYVKGLLASIPKDSLDDRIILAQVTLGLAYIHSKEMIHKDLKPANILLWRSPNCKTLILAKLADFDFAKQLKTAKSEFSGTFRPGTEGYMAPELSQQQQQKGHHHHNEKVLATMSSDAYSLGVTIAFTVMKGIHPFGNSKFIRERMMESGADPLLHFDLPWDVTDLILRLTRKDPKERPNVSFLIHHPYFVLANEKSRAHFAEKVDEYFNEFRSPYEARMAYVNENRIQEWMEWVRSQTERQEENAFMKNWPQQIKESCEEMRIHLEKSRLYYEKIKTEIQRDNDNDVSRTFQSDASKSKSFSGYFRDWTLWTRKLVESGPKCFVSYFWCLINDRIEEKSDSQHSYSLYWRYYDKQLKQIQPPDILRSIEIFKMEEHVYACLHLKCHQEIEEMWNLKRAGSFATTSALDDQEIHRWMRELPSYAAPSSVTRNLIDRLVNVNSTHGQDQTTVLHWILKNRWGNIDVSIVQDLLQKRKANANSSDKHGSTPVHYAAKNESSHGPIVLRLLLENGGDPSRLNGRERRRTPLHYAAMNESSYAPSITTTLLDSGVQVNVFDKHGFTSLHYAARNISESSPDVLKILLDRGADANNTLFKNHMEPPFNRTPVHMATMNESESGFKMLAILLERNGDPNKCDYDNETPVHYAAKSESNFGDEMMKTLLEKQGNLNAVSIGRKCPIHYAAENRSPSGPSLMKTILQKGGHPHTPFEGGETVLHLATKNPSEAGREILQVLLDTNGDPNQSAGYAVGTPVHQAARNRFRNGHHLLKLLLDKGGDPNAVDLQGKTPVHLAAENTSHVAPDLMEILLQNAPIKGNPNACDNEKMTPVHLAAANTSDSVGPSVLKILLGNGGDPNVADEKGETPLHYAAKNESNCPAGKVTYNLM